MKGTTLAHYCITDELGQGGMGEVYRATDTKLDREVAIKVLPEIFAQDKERLARFEREAKVLASLNHPNIAGIDGTKDVWSRFWPGTVTGSRNYDNAKSTIRSISKLTDPQLVPLIATDGYKFNERAIRT